MASWLSSIPRAAWIFAVLALVFAALTVREHLRAGADANPKRRAWLRLAVIFAAVTVMLVATQR